MVAALLALFNNDDATWPPSKTRRRFRAKSRFSSRGPALLFLPRLSQGHSAKNDLSTEALRDFCTRGTFLRSVPVDVGIRVTVFSPNDVGSVPNHVGTIFSFHLMWEVWP
jgi:hypothetical protein